MCLCVCMGLNVCVFTCISVCLSVCVVCVLGGGVSVCACV